MKFLTIIVGPTCSGKTTLANRLVTERGYAKCITTTTREVRDGEVDGVDYHFISVDDFTQGVHNDEFVEHEMYGTNFYGLSKNALQDAFDAGKGNAVIVMEINGYINLRNQFRYSKDISVTGIFIDAPITTLASRIRDRDHTVGKKVVTFRLNSLREERGNVNYFLNSQFKGSTRVLFNPSHKQVGAFVESYKPWSNDNIDNMCQSLGKLISDDPERNPWVRTSEKMLQAVRK